MELPVFPITKEFAVISEKFQLSFIGNTRLSRPSFCKCRLLLIVFKDSFLAAYLIFFFAS